MNDVMFSCDEGNRSKSKTTRMFRRVRQVAPPGAKSAVSDYILLIQWVLVRFVIFLRCRSGFGTYTGQRPRFSGAPDTGCSDATVRPLHARSFHLPSFRRLATGGCVWQLTEAVGRRCVIASALTNLDVVIAFVCLSKIWHRRLAHTHTHSRHCKVLAGCCEQRTVAYSFTCRFKQRQKVGHALEKWKLPVDEKADNQCIKYTRENVCK